jgi:hypothetical protein
MHDEGFWAEGKLGGEHPRLFSEHNALGVQASVYDVNAKNWIAPSELVDDIEQGKARAAFLCGGASQARRQLRTASIGVEEVPFGLGSVGQFSWYPSRIGN